MTDPGFHIEAGVSFFVLVKRIARWERESPTNAVKAQVSDYSLGECDPVSGGRDVESGGWFGTSFLSRKGSDVHPRCSY